MEKKEVVSAFINQTYTKMRHVNYIPLAQLEHFPQYVVDFEAILSAPGGLNKS